MKSSQYAGGTSFNTRDEVYKQLIVIGLAASLGAWMRWGLSLCLNPLFPFLPLGTLGANLIGGYLVGLLLPITADHELFSATTRLALGTGFLGALTTFSSFSAETTLLLSKHEYIWALLSIAAHLGGSLLMTMLGILSYRALF